MKKKRMTGTERKAQIVNAAAGLFAENGFKGTTTRGIAEKASVSEAVIFRHFRKKEEIYKAIIDARCSDDRGGSRLMAAIRPKKGREIFREVALFLLKEHSRDPSFMRLLIYSALEKQNLSEMFIKTRGLELIGYLAGRIKEMIEAGEMRKVDPKVAARAFMGMVLHYSVSQEIYGLKRYFKRPNSYVADIFVDIFFEGMNMKRRRA